MVEKSFSIKGSDGIDLHCYKWVPDEYVRVRGVFHLVHGSLEHVYRYIHFVTRLVSEGYIVYGSDLRGHGKTAAEDESFFYFSDNNNGWKYAVDDINIITDLIKQENPQLPVFIFGHSMGSFLVREFMTSHGDNINGVFISGTGIGKPVLQRMVLFISRIMMLFRGKKYRSPFLHHLVYGTLDNLVKGHEIKGDFISRDKKEVEKYQNDPYCTQTCTIDYVHEMISAVSRVNKPGEIRKNHKEIPVYFLSGGEDPVGDKGKGIEKLHRHFKKAGVNDISVNIYPEARHELLNEYNREEVMDDMVTWINGKALQALK